MDSYPLLFAQLLWIPLVVESQGTPNCKLLPTGPSLFVKHFHCIAEISRRLIQINSRIYYDLVLWTISVKFLHGGRTLESVLSCLSLYSALSGSWATWLTSMYVFSLLITFRTTPSLIVSCNLSVSCCSVDKYCCMDTSFNIVDRWWERIHMYLV